MIRINRDRQEEFLTVPVYPIAQKKPLISPADGLCIGSPY